MVEKREFFAGDLAGEHGPLRFVRCAHQHIALLLGAWLDARRGALVPLKSDLTPDSILSILPYVWVYRYEEAVDDFVCRISGERINDAWGQSLRGVQFRDIVGQSAHPAALRRWKTIIETPSIQYGKVAAAKPHQDKVIAERLVLPLADPDGAVCYTMGLSVYPYRQDDRDRTPPVWDDVTVIPCAELM